MLDEQTSRLKAPHVSIVCSAYNAGVTLRATLESALSQDGVTLELIVVNDGSTDGTAQILDGYAAADPRVHVIHKQNEGLTKALIVGCEAARGQYVARLDTDDICLPGRLRKQAALLDLDPELSFVSCWTRSVGPGDEPLYEICRSPEPNEATRGLRDSRLGPPHHGSVMFRKDLYKQVGGYRTEFYFAQDSDLWLRLVEVGKFACVPEFLYQFRVDPASISSKYRSVQHALGELGHACRVSRNCGESEAPILEQARMLRPGLATPVKPDPVAGDYFIGRCLLKRRDARASRYLFRVISRRPWMVGAWIGIILSFIKQYTGPR